MRLRTRDVPLGSLKSQNKASQSSKTYTGKTSDYCKKVPRGTNFDDKKKKYPKSKWVSDKDFEEKVMQFLPMKTPILKDLNWKGYILDKPTQLKGIDFYGELDGKEIKVDVKSIATDIDWPTFCFEIAGNVHSGQKGWLLDMNKETDYYLVTFHEIRDCGKNYKKGKLEMTQDNVLQTTAYLINRDRLITLIRKHLRSNDFDYIVQQIRDEAPNYRHLNHIVRYKVSNNSVYTQEKKGGELVWLTVSPHIYEQPINIVVNRELLKSISERIWVIDHEENICTREK